MKSLVEEHGSERIVINCGNIEFFASEMLGELIKLEKARKKSDGKKADLRLCSMKLEIYEVFAITRLNKLFKIFDSEEGALAAQTP